MLFSMEVPGDLWARWSLWISDQFSQDFIWNSIRHRMNYSINLTSRLLARVGISGILWILHGLWIRIRIWLGCTRGHLYDVFLSSNLRRQIHILFLAKSLGFRSHLQVYKSLLVVILGLFLSCTHFSLLRSLLVVFNHVINTIERSLVLILSHTKHLNKFGTASFWRILILVFNLVTRAVLVSCSF